MNQQLSVREEKCKSCLHRPIISQPWWWYCQCFQLMPLSLKKSASCMNYEPERTGRR